MGGRPQLTLKEFKNRAKAVHKGKYTYARAVWNGSQNYITITCPEHGDFEQKASPHLRGKGCKSCATVATNESKRQTIAEIKKQLKQLHPTMQFPNVHNVTTKNITFICKEHGEGEMRLSYLLKGQTCKDCASASRGKAQALTQKEFVLRAKKVFPKYDYTKSMYVNAHTKVIVKCPEHGDFEAKPWNLFQQKGCPKCSKKRTLRKIQGKQFLVESRAESTALTILLNTLKISAKEVLDRTSKQVPTIECRAGRMKRYLPDFYIPKKNMVVEVKSPESLGIKGTFYYEKSTLLIKRMQIRALKTIELGYKFRLIVVEGNKKLKMPRDWMYMNPSELRALFN